MSENCASLIAAISPTRFVIYWIKWSSLIERMQAIRLLPSTVCMHDELFRTSFTNRSTSNIPTFNFQEKWSIRKYGQLTVSLSEPVVVYLNKIALLSKGLTK
ncbi:hypothetical protein J6590_065859 [Homalodisca vitripennis]|nr:hypothetical protein J6590_065859 [Homalodisca vitripennis]